MSVIVETLELPSFPAELKRQLVDSENESVEFLTLRLLNRHSRVQISPSFGEPESLPGRLGLFAVSNKAGWCAAVCKTADQAYQILLAPLSELRDTFHPEQEPESNRIPFNARQTLSCPSSSPILLKFTGNGERLLLGTAEGILAIYDTSPLASGGHITASPKLIEAAPVKDIQPNPGAQEGQVAVLRGTDTESDIQIIDTNMCVIQATWAADTSRTITSISWSPLGKVLALGFSTGQVIPYKLDSPPSAQVNHSRPAVDSGLPVTSLRWLANTQFHIVRSELDYKDTDPDSKHIISSVDLSSTSITDVQVETPCPPFGTQGRPSAPQTIVLRNWAPFKALIITADGPAAELGFIAGTSTNSGEKWGCITVDETSTPSYPLDIDNNDTTLLGFDIDLTATAPIKGQSESGEDIERPAAPILYAYLSDGTIVGWNIFNDQGGRYPGMVNAGEPAASTASPATPQVLPAQIAAGTVERTSSAMLDDLSPPPSPTASLDVDDNDMDDSAFGSMSLGAPPSSDTGKNTALSMFGQPSASTGSGLNAFGTSGGGFGAGSAFASSVKPGSGAFGASATIDPRFSTPKNSSAASVAFGASGFGNVKPNAGFGFGSFATASPTATPTSSAGGANANPAFRSSSFGKTQPQPTFGASSFGAAIKPPSTGGTAGGFGAFASKPTGFGSTTTDNKASDSQVASVFSGQTSKPLSSGGGGGGGFSSFASKAAGFGAGAEKSSGESQAASIFGVQSNKQTSIAPAFSSPISPQQSPQSSSFAGEVALKSPSPAQQSSSFGKSPISSGIGKEFTSVDSKISPVPSTPKQPSTPPRTSAFGSGGFGAAKSPTTPSTLPAAPSPPATPSPPETTDDSKAQVSPEKSPILDAVSPPKDLQDSTQAEATSASPAKTSSFVSAFGSGGTMNRADNADSDHPKQSSAPSFGQSSLRRVPIAPAFGSSSMQPGLKFPSPSTETPGSDTSQKPVSGGFASFSAKTSSGGFAGFGGKPSAFSGPTFSNSTSVAKALNKLEAEPSPPPTTPPSSQDEGSDNERLVAQDKETETTYIPPTSLEESNSGEKSMSSSSSFEKLSASESSFASVNPDDTPRATDRNLVSTDHAASAILSPPDSVQGDEASSEHVETEPSDRAVDDLEPSDEGETDSLQEITDGSEDGLELTTSPISYPETSVAIPKRSHVTPPRAAVPGIKSPGKSTTPSASPTHADKTLINSPAPRMSSPVESAPERTISPSSSVSSPRRAASISPPKEHRPTTPETSPPTSATPTRPKSPLAPKTVNVLPKAPQPTPAQFGKPPFLTAGSPAALGLGRPSSRPSKSSPLASHHDNGSIGLADTPPPSANIHVTKPSNGPVAPVQTPLALAEANRNSAPVTPKSATPNIPQMLPNPALYTPVTTPSTQTMPSRPPSQPPNQAPRAFWGGRAVTKQATLPEGKPVPPVAPVTPMEQSTVAVYDGMNLELGKVQYTVRRIAHAMQRNPHDLRGNAVADMQTTAVSLAELAKTAESSRKTVEKLWHDSLKHEIQLQHIKKLSTAVKDARFNAWADSRPLDPDQIEMQDTLKRKVKDVSDLLDQLQSRLTSVQRNLEEQERGSISLKTPSLVTIDQTCVMLETAILSSSERVQKLQKDLKLLDGNKVGSPNHKAIQNSASIDSPVGSGRIPSGLRIPSGSVAKHIAGALNARITGHFLHNTLLAARSEPLFTDSVLSIEEANNSNSSCLPIFHEVYSSEERSENASAVTFTPSRPNDGGIPWVLPSTAPTQPNVPSGGHRGGAVRNKQSHRSPAAASAVEGANKVSPRVPAASTFKAPEGFSWGSLPSTPQLPRATESPLSGGFTPFSAFSPSPSTKNK